MTVEQIGGVMVDDDQVLVVADDYILTADQNGLPQVETHDEHGDLELLIDRFAKAFGDNVELIETLHATGSTDVQAAMISRRLERIALQRFVIVLAATLMLAFGSSVVKDLALRQRAEDHGQSYGYLMLPYNSTVRAYIGASHIARPIKYNWDDIESPGDYYGIGGAVFDQALSLYLYRAKGGPWHVMMFKN